MMKRTILLLTLCAITALPLCAQEIPMADQPVPVSPDSRFGSYYLGGLFDNEFPEGAKSTDFGLDVSLEVAKKITPRFDVSLGLNMRTQDNSRSMERRMLTLGLGYKIIDTRKFDLKAGFDFDYYGAYKMAEREDFEKMAEHYKDVGGVMTLDGYNYRKGYKITDGYWRGRERYSLSLSASYKPSKRWTFTIKETLQYIHAPVTGKTKMADTSVLLLFHQIAVNAVFFIVEIGIDVHLADIVKKIKIKIIHLQFFQLFIKDLFDLAPIGRIIPRKFCRHIKALPRIL